MLYQYGRVGTRQGSRKKVKIPSRVIRWTDVGLEYDADQRHADLQIKEMNIGMQNLCKSITANDDTWGTISRC